MSERLILQGALQDKKMERMRMATKAQGLIRAIKQILQFAAVTPLGDLRTGEALALMTDLHQVKTKYDVLTAEMTEIQKEMGIEN